MTVFYRRTEQRRLACLTAARDLHARVEANEFHRDPAEPLAVALAAELQRNAIRLYAGAVLLLNHPPNVVTTDGPFLRNGYGHLDPGSMPSDPRPLMWAALEEVIGVPLAERADGSVHVWRTAPMQVVRFWLGFRMADCRRLLDAVRAVRPTR